MTSPFYYTTFRQAQGPGGVSVHSARVLAANQGYGHRHDPIVMCFDNFRSVGELKQAVSDWAKAIESEVFTEPDQYMDRMSEALQAKIVARQQQELGDE